MQFHPFYKNLKSQNEHKLDLLYHLAQNVNRNREFVSEKRRNVENKLSIWDIKGQRNTPRIYAKIQAISPILMPFLSIPITTKTQIFKTNINWDTFKTSTRLIQCLTSD